MFINHKYTPDDDYATGTVDLEDQSLNNVKEFKYLGSYLHFNEPSTGDAEINHRIQMANAKFAEISNLLQNSKIHLRTRISFLDSSV